MKFRKSIAGYAQSTYQEFRFQRVWLKQTLNSKGWEFSCPYKSIGSLPESLTQELLVGKLLVGGLGVRLKGYGGPFQSSEEFTGIIGISISISISDNNNNNNNNNNNDNSDELCRIHGHGLFRQQFVQQYSASLLRMETRCRRSSSSSRWLVLVLVLVSALVVALVLILVLLVSLLLLLVLVLVLVIVIVIIVIAGVPLLHHGL